MTETRKYTISGRVQGVWYRRYTADAASEMGLRGWVRNTLNGNVEVLAKGDSQQFRQLQAVLWQGSPMSDVTDVVYEVVDDFTGADFAIDWNDSSNT